MGMNQGFVLSPFHFALVVDAVKQFAREGALSELLYADSMDLFLEAMKVLRNKLLNGRRLLRARV